MKTKSQFNINPALIIFMSCVFRVGMARSQTWEQEAHQILDTTGVRGGLIIHIGCGAGRLTAALCAGESYMVQGLDPNAKNVQQAREHVRSLDLYGRVCIDQLQSQNLPYVDNLVNLIIASDLGKVTLSEVMRVLCPGGVMYVKQKGRWSKGIKPWPDELDEWTHYLHGADNNAVAQDTVVGPPRHFQWISEPRFSRSHDHLASVSAMVSAAGRLFYIVDEGSIAFAAANPLWRLVARDAFNGVRLWERKISTWEYHLRDFRSGPADIARRLVAVGDRVYVTLGYGEPVVALDAATGRTVRTYAGTEGALEILYQDDRLFLVLGEPQEGWQAEKAKQIVSLPHYEPPFEAYSPPAHKRHIMAVAADTGEVLWNNSQPYTRDIMPSTLACSEEKVYFQNADAVNCLDATTGQLQWKAPRPAHRKRLAWSTPTLVVHDGIVFSADRRAAEPEGELLWIPSGGYHDYIRGDDVRGELVALDGETGERLWSCPAYEGFNAPVDVMIAGGLLWTGRYAWGNDPGITEGRDPRNGEVRRQRPPDQEFLPRIGHARCHRAKATARYLILGRRGVEFVGLKSGDMVANLWLRGICQYGVMPANGLLYLPPHSCACSVNDMLKCGFMAMAPENKEDANVHRDPEAELEKGPAYGFAPTIPLTGEDDVWPTYRHDPARSGATPAVFSHNLQTEWEANLGGKLSSPVIAGGTLLVAESDAHLALALDAISGRVLWTYTASARIDSPPTIDQGRVLFGSTDGRVYCLRLDDGELIWRFTAAPRDRRIVVDGQLESAWPVPGSVLVMDGAVYFTAGRTSYLDGGMWLYKLDAATGQVLKMRQLTIEPKKRDGGFASGGNLPDILSAVGDSIFMLSARFDLNLLKQQTNVTHIWSSAGLLDKSWWHRTYWQVGTSMRSGWGGWPKAGQQVPSGRLLVTDGSRVFGFGRNQYDTPGAHVGIDAAGVWGPIGGQQGRWTFYRLFGQTMDAKLGDRTRPKSEKRSTNEPDWTRRIPMLVRAMVLTNAILFIAGPSVESKEIPHKPTEVNHLAEALEAGRGGSLLAVSANNGNILATYDLKSPPVFDGMAAAGGRLYVTSEDGEILCLGKR